MHLYGRSPDNFKLKSAKLEFGTLHKLNKLHFDYSSKYEAWNRDSLQLLDAGYIHETTQETWDSYLELELVI